MKRKEYICPKCEGHLKVNLKIIFLAQKENGKRGLILLNPELGDYKRISHESLNLVDGEQITFLCPICHADLSAVDINKNLAAILMTDEDNIEYKILFSEILGEKCTYKVYKKEVEAFGEDSSQYMNYFGTGPQ
ncbi:MAG: hypothetical protein ABFR75_04445 [Acidobacteriota bacterium]